MVPRPQEANIFVIGPLRQRELRYEKATMTFMYTEKAVYNVREEYQANHMFSYLTICDTGNSGGDLDLADGRLRGRYRTGSQAMLMAFVPLRSIGRLRFLIRVLHVRDQLCILHRERIDMVGNGLLLLQSGQLIPLKEI